MHLLFAIAIVQVKTSLHSSALAPHASPLPEAGRSEARSRRTAPRLRGGRRGGASRPARPGREGFPWPFDHRSDVQSFFGWRGMRKGKGMTPESCLREDVFTIFSTATNWKSRSCINTNELVSSFPIQLFANNHSERNIQVFTWKICMDTIILIINKLSTKITWSKKKSCTTP